MTPRRDLWHLCTPDLVEAPSLSVNVGNHDACNQRAQLSYCWYGNPASRGVLSFAVGTQQYQDKSLHELSQMEPAYSMTLSRSGCTAMTEQRNSAHNHAPSRGAHVNNMGCNGSLLWSPKNRSSSSGAGPDHIIEQTILR